MIRAISLQSGSNGNCYYVESGTTRVLFDAGISGLQAQRRLEAFGVDIRRVDAVVLSHDHRDHVACAGVYNRKFGIPLYATEKTLRAAGRSILGELRDVRYFRPGDTLEFGPLSVETLPTPHDGAEGVAFIVQAGQDRMGLMTDLGHAFAGLREAIGTLDGVFLESNYDPEMLRKGPYPYPLQQRIRGSAGHLSNEESAELLRGAPRLRWACLAHLSQENNHPDLAVRTHRRIIPAKLPLRVASRHEPTGVFEL
jgi:phosphoribosyl 1,2-cyclic phosphodiesterase